MRLVSIASLITLMSTTNQRFVFPDDEIYREKLAEEMRRNVKANKNTEISSTDPQNLRRHDELINEIEDKMVTKTPTCKDNEEYCADPIFYPKDAIQNALKKQYKSLKTILPSSSVARGRSSLDDILLTSRSGSLDEWRNLCDTNTSFINPKVAKNKAGVSMFLVNSDSSGEPGDRLSDFSQRVRITRCAGDHEADHEGGHTGGQCGALGPGLVTRCRQEFTTHRLVALDPRGLELIVDEFRFPTSCSCLYRPILI